jgi:Na+-transporting methylmalonyl-CoA/oxaloacetate decarboxylase gamma subunit
MFNIFDFLILAERKKGPDFSWVVPVLFVLVWVVTGIGKFVKNAMDNRERNEKMESDSDQSQRKLRYKPIPDASAKRRELQQTIPLVAPVSRTRDRVPTRVSDEQRPKPPSAVASLKKAMHEAMQEAAAQQGIARAPKPVPARPKAARATGGNRRKEARQAPRKPVQQPERKVQPVQRQETVLSELLQKENIRKAIIYSEIIGKPMALRDC